MIGLDRHMISLRGLFNWNAEAPCVNIEDAEMVWMMR